AQDGALILATQRNLYRLSAAADRWAPMTNHEYRFEALFPLKSGGFLASIRQLGVVRLSPEGEVVERLQDIVPAKQEYREITQGSKGRYWVGAKRALLRIEGQAGSLRLRREKLPDIGPEDFEQAVDFEVDPAGRLWVGYFAGLAWLDDQDRWRKLV